MDTICERWGRSSEGREEREVTTEPGAAYPLGNCLVTQTARSQPEREDRVGSKIDGTRGPHQ
jgi:hypothetical protein